MSAHADPPDVLMIVVDDMNDWISLLDRDSPIETPNLERLAARGTLFTRAYCVSAACNPSRVATLTGLRPTSTGVYGNHSDWRGALPDRPTIMQQFKAAGYHVRGAGKIFHHKPAGAFHDEASFDEFQPMRRQLYPEKKLNGAPEYGSRNTDWGVWPKRVEDSVDHLAIEYCVAALKEPADQPQFLACGIYKPHSPFFAPAQFHQGLDRLPMPERKADDWGDLPRGARALMARSKWFWTGMSHLERKKPGSYRDFVRAYAACCRFADAQVGRLLDALDSNPRGKGTIVVLWSDHGFHLGEKDHIEKFALWEKSNHVPFIVVAPGVTEPGSRCETPVDLSVLYPTLLELAGLKTDLRVDGQSAVPLLKDPDAPWDQPALMTYGRGNHALRTERWRYIRYADGSQELYDHNADPNEWRNVVVHRQNFAVVARLRKWLPRVEAERVANLAR